MFNINQNIDIIDWVSKEDELIVRSKDKLVIGKEVYIKDNNKNYRTYVTQKSDEEDNVYMLKVIDHKNKILSLLN